MTAIQAEFRDSGNNPLTGYVAVTLDAPIVNTIQGKTYLPVTHKFTLVGGAIGFTLEPTEDDKTTYLFEVVSTTTYTPEPTEDVPDPDPVTLEEVVESFHAMVPDVPGTLNFTDLEKATLATKDTQDASLITIIRRLSASTEFWAAANTNLFRIKGVYNASASYINGDVVNFDGSAYVNISLTALTNQSPTQYPPGWRLLVAKGDTGSGTTGSTTPYNSAVWIDNVAPARSAVKDIIEQLAPKTTVDAKAPLASPIFTGTPSRNSSPPAADNSSQLANTAWVQALVTEVRKAIVPVGLVAASSYLSPPTGWLPCDGRVLLRDTYAALFALLGITWNVGGELATEFRLPDLRGRTIQGLDNMGTARGAAGQISPANALAATGGEQKHTMTLAELVAHSHTTPYSALNFAGGGGTMNSVSTTATGTSVSASSSGSTTPFNVMQPYGSLVWIIYTGL